ncbi:MAG: site-2 protease family protein [Candidatus Berkelbacteria bacterium]|nr:MAG: site-2 protease family protein [Candidatus Berkelbacteria bacterium]QQG51477.1 MAG: site-2 protease family protein [Candidatus Berkelbacteria bacterium]
MQLQDFGVSLILIIVILLSLSVHEYAHALVASIFGDDTAKREGRQTINPLAHWDPVGTTLLVGLLLLRAFGLELPVFGWGKPVPVNEDNFDNPRLQGLQVALAGPLSNLLLAALFAFVANLVGSYGVWREVLVASVYLNVFLMFFNLIPVPPLDGSRILRLFISDRAYYALSANPMIFFVLIFLAFGFLLNYLVQLSYFLTGKLLILSL